MRAAAAVWYLEVMHIRKGNESVHDRRFRCRVQYNNKMRPTLCGAEPTTADHSRDTAIHLVKYSALKPDWVAGICPTCLAALKAKG